MIEIEDAPDLVDPVVIAAFEGWNDAADAASGGGRPPDRGVGRPGRRRDRPRGLLRLPGQPADRSAPTTTATAGSPGPAPRSRSPRPPDLDRDVILIRGIEPNMRWRQFCAELLAACDELGGELVVTLGALLADTPHTRPIPVTGTATEPELVDRLKLEQSTYEGPDRHRRRLPGRLRRGSTCRRCRYWAAVPHYVAQPPCPKATLALLGQLEDLLEVSIPLGDLPEDARAWERGVDELAEEDEDIADYVRALEETRDTTDLPEASGEAIAREFERYLKRRGDGGRLHGTGSADPADLRGDERRAAGVAASRVEHACTRGVRVAGVGEAVGAERGGHPGVDGRERARGVEVVGQGGEHLRRPPARPGRRRRATSALRQRATSSTASQSSASVHSQSLR